MRRGFIKKLVMTASLGLALFFSGPALAVEIVVASCAFDRDTGGLILGPVHTSSDADLPVEVVEGAGCLDAIKALKEADCKRLDFLDDFTPEKLPASGWPDATPDGANWLRGADAARRLIVTAVKFAVACP